MNPEIDFNAVAVKQANEYAALKFRNVQLEVLVETLQGRINVLESEKVPDSQPSDEGEA